MNHKRIITVDETADKVIVVGIEDDGSAYVSSADILELPKYTEPDLEQVRKEAYKKGYETAKHECDDCSKQAYTDTLRMDVYRKGLSDAWEAARKICLEEPDGGMQLLVINDIFNVSNYRDALKDYSASEAIEKIRQYEEEKEEQDGLRQNIQTIVDQCGYSLDEIAEVLTKMKES